MGSSHGRGTPRGAGEGSPVVPNGVAARRDRLAFRTRAAHAGDDPTAVRPLAAPIHQGSVYAFPDAATHDLALTADPPGPTYSRSGSPNAAALEAAVADLEGAEAAVVAASGMAAIALVFLAHLSAGDHAVLSADCYADTGALVGEEMARFGVTASFVDTCNPANLAAVLTPRTRLVYVETISNPAMKLCDFPRIVEFAHAAGALVCVDNTFATPALCRPLGHGADLVVHSATKFLGGHHDLTAGVVAGRRDLIDRVRRCGYLFGPTLGALDAWLALRGIHTLAPRMAWVSATAAEIAAFLAAHPAVARVRYPGLPGSRQAALADRLLPDGAGGMLAFDLAGGQSAADAFVRALRLIPYAPSLGGTGTTVSYPPRRDPLGEVATAGTVRVSVGLEAPADLIADLTQALAVAAASPGAVGPPRVGSAAARHGQDRITAAPETRS